MSLKSITKYTKNQLIYQTATHMTYNQEVLSFSPNMRTCYQEPLGGGYSLQDTSTQNPANQASKATTSAPSSPWWQWLPCCSLPTSYWLADSAALLDSMSTSMPYFSHHQSLHCEDEGRMVLQNTGILQQNYMASQSRRPWSESSPL